MTLGELVRKAREDKGWDQTQLANAAGYSQAAISDIEAGRTAAPRSWRKLAAALGLNEARFREAMIGTARDAHDMYMSETKTWLRSLEAGLLEKATPFEYELLRSYLKAGDIEQANRIVDVLRGSDTRVRTADVSPNATITGPVERPDPNSIPVHGRAKGGDDGKYEFNGDVIGWEPRPAKLRGISGVYAVYIDGESMYPRYKAGETVVAQPGRPIARGDDVIVQLAANEENEAPYGYVKEFVRWTPTKLVLSQFNPKQEIEFARDQVVSVHRIVHADR